jgi:hypothetical protein
MKDEMHLERSPNGRVKMPLSNCLVKYLESLDLNLDNKTVFNETVVNGRVIIEFQKKKGD